MQKVASQSAGVYARRQAPPPEAKGRLSNANAADAGSRRQCVFSAPGPRRPAHPRPTHVYSNPRARIWSGS